MEDSMSAAVAWDIATAPVAAPGRLPGRPVRPSLTSVPCGEAAVARPAAPVRITRAGRLAVTLTVAVALAVLALVLFPGGASGTFIDHSTTVQSGQTLSEVAARELPQLPVADAVARIQVANDLASAQVHAGQSLLIPHVG
jgi:hypothetical protein